MCLYKKSIFPRITLTNKRVYKVVAKEFIGDNVIYKTPCRNMYVNLGETYTGIFKRGDIISSMFSKAIEDGYIHCYKKEIHAAGSYYANIIIECEIPKWTLYWKGIHGDIATRKLKYLREL